MLFPRSLLTVNEDRVTLWWKGVLPAVVDASLRAARRDVQVEVRAAAHSRAELKRAATPIRKLLKANPNAGFHGIALPADGSGIILQSDGDPSAALRSIPQVGVPVTAVRESFSFLVDTRQDDSRPWSGGGRLLVYHHFFEDNTDLYLGRCTAGFGVHDSAGRRYLLTAGHCGAPNITKFTDGVGEFIGYGGSEHQPLDLLLIPADSANNMWDGGVNGTSYLRWLAGSYDAIPGEEVCTSGATSGRICNIWVSDLFQEMNCGRDAYLNWECVYDLVRAYKWDGPAANVGDSGGPVFNTTSSGRVIAKGIISGGGYDYSTGRYSLLFQDFVSAQRVFGINVNLTL